MAILLATTGTTLNVAGLLYFDWRLNIVGLVPSVVGFAWAVVLEKNTRDRGPRL